MTVLSKQYTLLDLIHIRNGDIYANPSGSSASVSTHNKIYSVLSQLAKDNEHMTYNEFHNWFSDRNLGFKSVA